MVNDIGRIIGAIGRGQKEGPMRDLARDWNRWSKAERITALCLAAIFVSALPSYLFLAVLNAPH